MNLFQWVSLSVLCCLLAWELLRRRRRSTPRGMWLLRCLVWSAAGVAIAEPYLVTWLGTLLGIGRGADLVMYLFVFAFLGTSFYFYARYVRLQRQVTQLVRHLAHQEAERGAVAGTFHLPPAPVEEESWDVSEEAEAPLP